MAELEQGLLSKLLSRIPQSAIVVLFFLAASISLAAQAQQEENSSDDNGHQWNPELRGTLNMQWSGFTRDGGTQKWDTVLNPELSLDLGDWGSFILKNRLRLDPVDKLEPGEIDTGSGSRGYANRRQAIGDYADLELREFYIDADVGDSYLRLGKQQIVWGEADGLRVLDLINPQSFREFILSDVESRRIPVWAVNLEIPAGDLTTQLIWIPDHTYDEFATSGETFEFNSPLYSLVIPDGALASGVIVIDDVEKPNDWFSDDDFGFRVSGFNAGWDWSANYLYHYFDQPVIYRTAGAGGTLRITPEYERTHVVGFTGSKPVGKVTFRGEVAYSTKRFFNLSNTPANLTASHAGVFSTGELGTVLGFDYLPDGETIISTQMFQSTLLDRATEANRDAVETTFSLRASREFRNDTFVAQAQILNSVSGGDGVVNLDFTYKLRSEIELTFGVDAFFGNRTGLFGQFEDNSRASLGVVFSY